MGWSGSMKKIASFIRPLVERRLERSDCEDRSSKPVEMATKLYPPLSANELPARLLTMGDRFLTHTRPTQCLKDCSANHSAIVRIRPPITHGMSTQFCCRRRLTNDLLETRRWYTQYTISVPIQSTSNSCAAKSSKRYCATAKTLTSRCPSSTASCANPPA